MHKNSSLAILAAGVAGFLLAAAIAHSAPIQTLARLVSVQSSGLHSDEASGARTESPEPSESPEESPKAEPSEQPEPSPSATEGQDGDDQDENNDDQGENNDHQGMNNPSPSPGEQSQGGDD
jgi:hypothetical protein